VLAQLLGAQQVLGGGESQRLLSLLIGAQRLAQATLRCPDVGQRDRTAEDVAMCPVRRIPSTQTE
jgi:hypothetical protein